MGLLGSKRKITNLQNKIGNILPHKIKIENCSVRILSKNDIELVQKFFEHNRSFFIEVGGKKLQNNEAELFFNLVPQDKTIDDKVWIGVFDNEKLIAFANLLSNHEVENNWYIGLFIIDIDYRRKGIATKFLNGIEELLLTQKVDSLGAIIQKNNSNGLLFWKKMDSEKTGRKNDNDLIFLKKIKKKENDIQSKYFNNNILIAFPSKFEEQKEIFKIMQKWFAKEKIYTEKEINNIIKSKIICRNYATIRRDLIDHDFLNRSNDGKEYFIKK